MEVIYARHRVPPAYFSRIGREQGLGEIRYVSDLQFVDEPAPSEPVWIAD